jgi:hypothetical protein
MKSLFLLAGLIVGLSLKTSAQEDVTLAAKEACSCLKDLDPDKVSQRELNLELIGCVSRPVDGIAEALKKKNAWADSMALTYLGLVSKEARALCPEAFARLKKKEVQIDPALLAIKPEAEIIPGFSQAVCNCLGVLKDVNECVKKVGNANEAEMTRRFPNSDPFTTMMGLGMEVMFDLADRCELASSDATIAQIKKYPSVKEECSSLVTGEFSTKTILGETRSKFTANKLQEFSDGKLTVEYTLKWTGCSVATKCISSTSDMTKKGEESTMEIRRASNEGFIALVHFGKMKVPVFYTKVK